MSGVNTPSEKKQHTSRCLACKSDYTFDVEFEGPQPTKNGALRYMRHGTCPKGHKIRTFVKKPGEIEMKPIQKKDEIDEAK